MAQKRSAALPFILVTLLLDVLGIGLIIPVLPKLVTTMGGGNISENSGLFGWFVAIYASMQFLFSPVLGSLSDTYGRRPVILLSLVGAGLDYLLLAFAPSLEWLFVGRVISGITGANMTAINAYVADVSPPEKRAQNYGLMGAMFGIGFILGPAVGGLLGSVGPRIPFLAASALNLLNALYGFFVLPESLEPKNRKPLSLRTANPISSLGALARHPILLGLAGTMVCVSMAQQVLYSTWVLFTTFRFQWTELQNGLSLSVVGITAAVVQGGLTRVAVKQLGERKALVVGLGFSVVSYVMYGLATQGWMLYAILVVGSLGGIAGPSVQALISKAAGPSEQGTVQGAISSIMSLTGVVGPVVFTHLFGYFTSDAAPMKIPGVAFFGGAALIFLGMLLAVRTFSGFKDEPEGPAVAAGGAPHA